MLQACLNGSRSRKDHPQLPLTPAELAHDAERVVKAGVSELHVHPRDARGAETLAADDIAAALEAIRAKVPGIPVGVSTREGIRTDDSRGFDRMKSWTVLPDYVSVNLSEDDADGLITLMLDKGVAIEAGLSSLADAQRFVGLGSARICLRVLVEIDFEDEVAKALRLSDDIMALLAQNGVGLPILLHGFDKTVWPLYRKSIALGLDARLGLEDGTKLPDGRIAADNLDIIAAARQFTQER